MSYKICKICHSVMDENSKCPHQGAGCKEPEINKLDAEPIESIFNNELYALVNKYSGEGISSGFIVGALHSLSVRIVLNLYNSQSGTET